MDTISRRRFLALTGGTGVAVAANILSITEIADAAITRPLPQGTPILVVVTLYGGNDGLNTVVPYADSLYYSLRPGISYAADKILPLDSELGLNPAMKSVKSLWDKKKVAIIRGVGYPNPDHSHFTSMAIWQSAERTQTTKSGWLGRWVDSQSEDPLLAINLGSVLPPLLVGRKRSGSVLPLGGLITPSGTLARDCTRLSLPAQGENALAARAAISLRNLLNISQSVSPILKAPAPAAPTDLPTVNGGNAGGDNNLSQQLDVVAKLVAAGAPTRVWAVSLGGFDTHANEANAQSDLIGIVSESVSRFLSQLEPSGRSRDVTVMIYSEFGRRVTANASAGTDHGTSGPVFIIGDRVAGGFYGEQPKLSELNKGDLAVTTDFRDIYATLLEDVLQTPAGGILNGWKGRINSLLRKR